MCRHGNVVPVYLRTPGMTTKCGETGETVRFPDTMQVQPIDSCIATLVEALNRGGILTSGSCCGHDDRVGSILLSDGRELVILPEWASTARAELNADLPLALLRNLYTTRKDGGQ